MFAVFVRPDVGRRLRSIALFVPETFESANDVDVFRERFRMLKAIHEAGFDVRLLAVAACYMDTATAKGFTGRKGFAEVDCSAFR